MSPDRDLAAADLPPPLARLLALAERDPRRAAAFALARLGPTAADPCERLALGWALLRWERVPAARQLLASAHDELAKTGDTPLARLCRLGLLTARQLDGEGASLQPAWAELAAACAAAGEAAAAARCRCEQVAHLNLLGRPGDARELAQTIRAAIWQHGAPADQARHCHVAGVAAANCGDLVAAEALLDEASRRFAALRLPVQIARVRFEQSWLWQRRELYAEARAELQRALRVFRRFELPLRVAICEKDLGLVAARGGDYGAAIASTVRAREQLAALGLLGRVAGCDQNLGMVAHYSGLFELAQAAYERAHAAYVQLGNRRLALICRRNQAMILVEQDRLEEAHALLDSFAAELRAVGDRLEEAEGLVVRAHAQARRDPATALCTLSEAQARFAAMGSAAAAAECLLDQGWLHLGRGEHSLARACFEAAHEPLAGRPAHLWRLHYGRGRLLEADGAAAAALDAYEQAGALVAGMRRGLASEHASSGIFAQAGQLYADGIGLAARLGDPARLLALAEQQRALVLQRQLRAFAAIAPANAAELEAQRLRMRALLNAQAPPAALDAAMLDYVGLLLHARHQSPPPELPPAPRLDLEQLRGELRAAHGDDWSLLATVAAGPELQLVTLTPTSLTLESTPCDAALAKLIERACLGRYRLHTYNDLPTLRGGAGPPWATLSELGERLIPPVLGARLHPGHRLLIVPDGALHALPWAALRPDGAWLAERAVIELLPALAALRPLAPRALPVAPALLVGCAEFGERAPPLPRALESLDLVAGLWPGPATRLAGAAASRVALLELAAAGALRPYGLLHLATHAHMGSRGLLAHIKCADDDLLIDEVLRLGLGDSVVMLAACSGAASEVLPGDELLSLGRALLAAGASAVVAGLWELYDAGALRLLESFYAAMAAGADPALALARAQRAMLATADDGLPSILGSPLVWASLCVQSVGLSPTLEAGGTTPAPARSRQL
jgi:tetratricopeptide (TPR) repeat protein